MTLLLAAAEGPNIWFGWGYALAAYVVIFTAFFGYLAYLHVSHRRLRRRLDELQRQLRKRGET